MSDRQTWVRFPARPPILEAEMKIKAQVKRQKKAARPLNGDQQTLIRNAARKSHRQYGEAFKALASR